MTDYRYLNEHAIEAFENYRIPKVQQDSLIRYIEHGIVPGSFLCAVLKNDLYGAVSYADLTNRREIATYVQWLTSHAPIGCWGHEAAISNWQHVLQTDEITDEIP